MATIFFQVSFADKMVHKTFVCRLQSLIIHVCMCRIGVGVCSWNKSQTVISQFFSFILSLQICFFHISKSIKIIEEKQKLTFLFGLKDRFMSEYL